MSEWATTIYKQKYAQEGESWADTAYRVASNVVGPYFPDKVDAVYEAIKNREFMPGGRYLYAAGKPMHQVNNCCLLTVEDSREGWASLMERTTKALMTGAGVGVVYSNLREAGAPVRGMGGASTGPIALMQMVNEAGRHIMQGGARRSAIWAGLHWNHPDIFDFITLKDWSDDVRALKEKDFNFPAAMDGTNVSVILDDDFFEAIHDPEFSRMYVWGGGEPKEVNHVWAKEVYNQVITKMLTTAEPGLSIDVGVNAGEHLRNACTEITSSDDNDICNLGSINMAQTATKSRFAELVEIGTLFLLCGTMYSQLPYEQVEHTRTKNRRLGLGLMGIYEWLVKRGYTYDPNDELAEWLEEYTLSTKHANYYSDQLGISRPVKTRAIAPTGCQKPDTLVTTDDGILELAELGDINGEQWQGLNITVAQENDTKVEASRFFVNGYADTKKVTLSSGLTMEATPNHQYRVLTPDGAYVWRRTDELASGDLLVTALNTYKKTSEPQLIDVPVYHHNEVEAHTPSTMTPELAWFIGLFFAEGSIHAKGIRIHTDAAQPFQVERVRKSGVELFGIEPTIEDNGRNCVAVCFNSSHLLRWLYVNGLNKQYSKSAEICRVIRMSSADSIRSFIDGYWFGDGSMSGAFYIDTSSEKMARQLVVVGRAVGYDSTIRTYPSGLGTDMFRVCQIKTVRRSHKPWVTKALKELGLENCTVDEVRSVEDGRSMTVDIEVPDTVTYIADGLVSHNTIGILAETTTGIEPLFASAYKRRYLKGRNWHYQYVADATAQRLIDSGVHPSQLESAYELANTPERRIAFQAWVQQWVDHGISSTLNLPAPDRQTFTHEEFGTMLLQYLPRLRGVTAYPDGARGGQPLNVVPIEEAYGVEGIEFEEFGLENACVSGVCGV